MFISRRNIAAGLLTLSTALAAQAAAVFSPDFTEGVTTDLFDDSQGARTISSSLVLQFGGEDLREAFGTFGGVEGGNVMFNDGQAIGFTDFIEWQTAATVNLSSIELRFSQDGGDANRSTASYTLLATSDGFTYSAISSGTVPLTGGPGSPMQFGALLITDSALGPAAAAARGFRLEVQRNSGSGPRLREVDGFGTVVPQSTNYLDRLVFNSASNGAWTGQNGDDETFGQASGFTFSSNVQGTDTVEDLFGNRNGAVEPESFIFGDGGLADNGNFIFGDGGETVDFVQWTTATPITLAGFRLSLAGDGLSAARDTELIRFLVEGVEVDLYDNNGFDGDITRLFPGGSVVGDDFRIEFTRTTDAGGRLAELDAITGVIPEPSSALLGAFGVAVLGAGRRRSVQRA